MPVVTSWLDRLVRIGTGAGPAEGRDGRRCRAAPGTKNSSASGCAHGSGSTGCGNQCLDEQPGGEPQRVDHGRRVPPHPARSRSVISPPRQLSLAMVSSDSQRSVSPSICAITCASRAFASATAAPSRRKAGSARDAYSSLALLLPRVDLLRQRLQFLRLLEAQAPLPDCSPAPRAGAARFGSAGAGRHRAWAGRWRTQSA